MARAIQKIYDDPNNPLSYPNTFIVDRGIEYMGECRDLLLSYDVRIQSRAWFKGFRINDNIFNNTPTLLIGISSNKAVKKALKGKKIIARSSVEHRRPVGYNELLLPSYTKVWHLLEPGELEAYSLQALQGS
uniref:Integrase catalytic domain-containing protein n=1 Tax=Rhizophagus irregularis (strain DAOM 181602 / DAOM 197198 / MUCL 43194) TaxID=747089 RepID=U9U1E8_RHIID